MNKGRYRAVTTVFCCGLLLSLFGCGANSVPNSSSGEPSDPLIKIQSSTQVVDTERAICEKSQQANPWPAGVKLVATSQAEFRDVRSAMVRQWGQSKADAATPELSETATVTLCALDTSTISATPSVSRAVLAVAEDSTWWASGSLA